MKSSTKSNKSKASRSVKGSQIKPKTASQQVEIKPPVVSNPKPPIEYPYDEYWPECYGYRTRFRKEQRQKLIEYHPRGNFEDHKGRRFFWRMAPGKGCWADV